METLDVPTPVHRDVAPEGLESVLRELSYPVVRPDAAAALSGVGLVLEDRTVNLGGVISDTGQDVYRTPEALRAAVEEVLFESPPS